MKKKKNVHAQKLGQLGGRATAAKRSQEQRSSAAQKASTARWENKPLSMTKWAIAQRKHRAKIAAEQIENND